jgi:hypothetical protein
MVLATSPSVNRHEELHSGRSHRIHKFWHLKVGLALKNRAEARREQNTMKMTAELFGALFAAGAFVFVLLVSLLALQWRRRKYGLLAEALGAQYESNGFARTGKITGSQDGRAYRIETRDFGRGGVWTVVTVECTNRGLDFSLHGSFFKNFPNWKYAFATGNGTDKPSGMKIALLPGAAPLEERYRTPVQRLFQEAALEGAEILRRGNIRIEPAAVSFTGRGVLTDASAIQQLLFRLTDVARHIESDPIQ